MMILNKSAEFEGHGLALKHFVVFTTPDEYPAGSWSQPMQRRAETTSFNTRVKPSDTTNGNIWERGEKRGVYCVNDTRKHRELEVCAIPQPFPSLYTPILCILQQLLETVLCKEPVLCRQQGW